MVRGDISMQILGITPGSHVCPRYACDVPVTLLKALLSKHLPPIYLSYIGCGPGKLT